MMSKIFRFLASGLLVTFIMAIVVINLQLYYSPETEIIQGERI
jgi:hypothetical protein